MTLKFIGLRIRKMLSKLVVVVVEKKGIFLNLLYFLFTARPYQASEPITIRVNKPCFYTQKKKKKFLDPKILITKIINNLLFL